eukprot:1601608-Amphidinium_carterae.3
MAARRKYPFASGSASAPDVTRVLPEVNLANTTKQVVLIFHGTFAPFHLGHLSCIWDAKRLLTQHGFEVIMTVLGCTTEHQLRRNLVVVLRSGEMAMASESFDKFAMFGVCRQTQALGMSSTLVRAQFDTGCIPVDYKASTLALLRSIFPQAVFRSPSRGSEAELTAKKDRAQGIPVIPRDPDTSVPVQKAMPARRPLRNVVPCVSTSATGAASTAGAVPAAAPKPPLVRKRVQLAPRVEQGLGSNAEAAPAASVKPPLKRKRVQLASREQQELGGNGEVSQSSQSCSLAPLPRAQPQPLTISDPLPCSGLPVTERVPADRETRDELMARLRYPGVLKLAPPALAHLGTFFRCVVVPICALMQITPHSLARRNLDPTLRVTYSPATSACKPLSFIMEVEQFMELNQALGHLRLIGYHCVALTIDNLLLADKDPDTCRGLAVKDAFLSVGELISQQLLVGNIVFVVTMLDAHHLVCVARANASVSMGVLAGQVCTVLNSIFRSARSKCHLRQQTISFSVDLGKCIFADGGMQGPHSQELSAERAREQPCCASRFPVLHCSLLDVGDPVADCLQWVLKKKTAGAAPRIPPVNSNLRALVRLWMVMAAEQRILVAGVLLVHIADDWGVSIRECVETICSPSVSDSLVTIFVYAALPPPGRSTFNWLRLMIQGHA